MIIAYIKLQENRNSQEENSLTSAINNYAEKNKITIFKWYRDKADSTAEYHKMKDKLKQGDCLIITSMKQLLGEGINIETELTSLYKKAIKLVVLDIPYMNHWHKINDEAFQTMMMALSSALIKDLTQSIENTGTTMKGRPKEKLPEFFTRAYESFLNGELPKMTYTELAKSIGIGRSTLYKYIGIYNSHEEAYSE